MQGVSRISTEPVPCTSVSVNRRNNEARAHIADLWIQTYTEQVPLKYGKHATKYPWIYRHFLQYWYVNYLQTVLALFKFDDTVLALSFACNDIVVSYNGILSVTRQAKRHLVKCGQTTDLLNILSRLSTSN